MVPTVTLVLDTLSCFSPSRLLCRGRAFEAGSPGHLRSSRWEWGGTQ